MQTQKSIQRTGEKKEVKKYEAEEEMSPIWERRCRRSQCNILTCIFDDEKRRERGG